MSTETLDDEIQSMLEQLDDDQSTLINQLDKLVQKFGIESVQNWRNIRNKSKNALIHELVERNLTDVVRHTVSQYYLNTHIHRESDGKNPIQLAQLESSEEMLNLLEELENNPDEYNDTNDDEIDVKNCNKLNMVWLDLEMTSLEDPKIMECAVIITDKYLNELARDEWVVHYEQSELSTLGEWHQNQFKSIELGGNGLFDDCLKSKLTEAQVEENLLKLLKRYCPEKECPLAGSSIHIDKEVLKKRMPRIHDYLTYRIVDVSSFRGMIRRWAPKTESKFMYQLSRNGRDSVNHRAMDDIEWSIEFMKLFQPLLAHNTAIARRRNKKPNQPKKQPLLFADEQRLLSRIELDKKTDVTTLNLDVMSERIYNFNPHLREIFIDHRTCVKYNGIFQKKNRFLHLSPHAPARELFPTKNITTEHWGQRKLLVTEIEFLTQFARNGKYLVIYIGFSQGLYINYLCDLFPNVDFVLIGTRQITCEKSSRVQIRSGELIDDWIKLYSKSDKNLLLICDMHTFGPRKDMDECIQRDLENQISWHSKLKPIASLLTFRLSRSQSTTKFLQGDVVLGPWTSRRTIDYRFVTVQHAELTTYDNKRMLSALSYFQNVIRTQYYEHDIDDSNSEGLDHCYDCRAEINILYQYLIKFKNISDTTMIHKAILQMSHDISTNIYDKNRLSIIQQKRTLDIIPKIIK